MDNENEWINVDNYVILNVFIVKPKKIIFKMEIEVVASSAKN